MLCHVAYPEVAVYVGGYKLISIQAIALCRVSTKGQLMDGNLEPQKARIIKAAEYLDVEVARWWELAVSSRKGKNIKRKDLLEMIEFCKKHRAVKYLIVDEVDRFMRSIDEYYWWKVQFKNIGVQLRHANRPEVDPSDDRSIFDELIDVYRAESSNNERIHKTPDKQMAKMCAGYYTFAPLPGYRTSSTPSLHEVDPERFTLLQRAFKALAARTLTVDEALKQMTANGYRTINGNSMDMARFKQLAVKPYYAGIIQVSDWPVATEHGLHVPMISKDEHEMIKFIVSGKKKKFVVNKKNDDFPLNEMLCFDCYEEAKKQGKLTGYRNHNGKKKDVESRRYYYRYRCRGCNNYFKRAELHGLVSTRLDRLSKDIVYWDELTKSLKTAWKSEVENTTNRITALERRKHALEDEQTKLAVSLANAASPAVVAATQNAIELNAAEVQDTSIAIQKLSNDDELDEFIGFAVSYTEQLRQNYWKLDWPDRKRCEQLLFPDGFYTTRQKKVYTPRISAMYRSKSIKKEPRKALVSVDGGPGGTRTHDTLLKRQVL